MGTISTGQLTPLVDNLARVLLDSEAALISGPGTNAPTVATILTGLSGAGPASLAARVAALGDISEIVALGPATQALGVNFAGLLTVSKNLLYLQTGTLMVALDRHVGGLNAFLAANSLQVHPEFAAAFNYIAANAASLGLTVGVLTAITPAVIFPASESTLASVSVTGVTAGTFTGGTALNLAQVAPQPLWLKNTAGAPTTGTATTFSVTYVNASGNSVSGTPALSGALAAGAYLATGLVGSAVSAISVTANGANGDALALVVKPLRVVGY